ncbi:MAG: hypothetical protein ACKOWF_12995 [Chloroflexota bacterium]
MDTAKFDALTRAVADRRTTVMGVALAGAGLVGLGTVASVAAEDAVEGEGSRGPGKSCGRKAQCGKGLKCADNGKCEYKGRNCGKENYTCRRGSDCCGKLVCQGKRCVEKDM